MNPIFYENKIELCDAVYEGYGSGWGTNWGITDEMRNAKYSVIMTTELKKIINERLLEQENAPKRKYTPKRITSKK